MCDDDCVFYNVQCTTQCKTILMTTFGCNYRKNMLSVQIEVLIAKKKLF